MQYSCLFKFYNSLYSSILFFIIDRSIGIYNPLTSADVPKYAGSLSNIETSRSFISSMILCLKLPLYSHLSFKHLKPKEGMFKKLRLKLTLFNMVVFGGILAIFSLMIFLSGNYKEADISIQEMWTIAMKDDLFELPNADLSSKENMIYVKVDNKKNVEEENCPDDFKKRDIEQMIGEAIQSMKYNGQIRYRDKKYLFLKIILDNDEGSIFAFKEYKNNLSDDKSFAVRTIFYITIYLILGFLGSLFMSGRALIPIKSAWQRQNDFTADASHELRTPLAVIQANLELVMDNGEETVESQKKWMSNILTENKRMSKLVNELLTLSRADTETYKVKKENFRLDKLLAETRYFR